MSANVGNQTVSIIYYAAATSANVNRRFLDVRPRGIYKGGYLTIVDSTHASLSALVCEIGDSSNQVRIETEDAVSVTVASATPYVVLRWQYIEVQANAYMDFVATATPLENDLIVAKCNFTGGGALLGFDYTERTIPSVQDKFLRVEATPTSELRVRVRGGSVQSSSGSTVVPDQLSSLITPPSGNSRVYLIYVDPETGVVNIDSTGVAAASPEPPAYNGKLVLAEVTVASTDTDITYDMIKDVRPFLTRGPISPDEIYIELASGTGKYTLKDSSIVGSKCTPYFGVSPKVTPGWSLRMSSATYTNPGQFVAGDPVGLVPSLGVIYAFQSQTGTVMHSMRVYNASGAVKSISQLVKYVDDTAYFYLNNTTTPILSFSSHGYKETALVWNLQPGINDLYCLFWTGLQGGLAVMGNILNTTDVYYVGPV